MSPRKGKYGKVIEKLGLKQLPADPDRNLLVDKAKQSIINDAAKDGDKLTTGHLGQMYFDLRKEKDDLENQLENVQLELEAVHQMIVAKFEEEGLSRIVLDGGASIGASEEPYPTVKDPDKLRAWAIKNDLADALTLNWQTLKSLTKERLMQGQPAPDGVEVFYKTQLERRKGTGPGDFTDIPDAPQT